MGVIQQKGDKSLKTIIKAIVIILLGLILSSSGNYSYFIEPLATYYYAKKGAKTASGDKINPEKVRTGEHRWIAISKDLKKQFKIGDTVIIISKYCPELNGEWVILDYMASKWKNKIDFLVHQKTIRSIGFKKPHRVKMRKK